MGHHEDVCQKCFKVLSNPAFSLNLTIALSCPKKNCPEKINLSRRWGKNNSKRNHKNIDFKGW